MKRDELERDLRDRVFRPRADAEASGGHRGRSSVGLEVELLPVRVLTGRRVGLEADAVGAGSRELLEHVVGSPGWRANGGGDGVLSVDTPGGARISFEPGGQLEYSSPCLPSLEDLTNLLREELTAVRTVFERSGVTLLAQGIDPIPGGLDLPLQLETPRYRRMARSFEAFEPAGRRMMRHTASVHVNLDWGDDPWEEWDVANRLTPVFAAAFANSPTFQGRSTGYRSFRTLQWVELDPRRSGPARGADGDPVEEYLDFALAAPAFLLGPDEPPYTPFSEWLGNGGVDREDWERHLSTLFPEVRPRGYLEFRSVDALPLEWLTVPSVLLRGLLHHPPSRRRVRGELPLASREALKDAARRGVRDPRIRDQVVRVARLGIQGARELSSPGMEGAVQVAERYVDGLLVQGRDPGEAASDPTGNGRVTAP